MKKIVWISSYPKSGNTFLRAMLSAFFYSKDGTFKQDYLKNISEFPRDFFDFKPKNNFLNEVKEYKKVQKKISSTDLQEVHFFAEFVLGFRECRPSASSCGRVERRKGRRTRRRLFNVTRRSGGYARACTLRLRRSLTRLFVRSLVFD